MNLEAVFILVTECLEQRKYFIIGSLGVALQALDWNLCPETPISWLKLYAQVDAQTDGQNFLVPQFSQETYIQITQVPPHHSQTKLYELPLNATSR